MSKESLEHKNLGIKVEDLRIILSGTINRHERIREKIPECCPDCGTKLEFDNSSYSSTTKHTEVYYSCEKCEVNHYFCFDENMNKCTKAPWEH